MTATTLVRTAAAVEGFVHGKSDALALVPPTYTYPKDIDLYAHDDYVAGYVDGYESVSDPV